MNVQMFSDAELQYHQTIAKPLLQQSPTRSYVNPKSSNPPSIDQSQKTYNNSKVSLTKNSNSSSKFSIILVIFLWLISMASLSTIIYMYSQKKRFLLKKMETLYLIGVTIISLMDICIGLIGILYLCSNFRFRQVLIFTNILKIVGFTMLIFDYDKIEYRIKGNYPHFFLVNLYIESCSSLVSFILLFYFIVSSFNST